MREDKILSAFIKDKDVWEAYSEQVDRNSLEGLYGAVYDAISDFRARDPKKFEVDTDILQEIILQKYPKAKSGISELIARLNEDVSIPNLIAVLEEHRKESLGIQIVNHLNTERYEEAAELFEQLTVKPIEEETEEGITAAKIEDLATAFNADNLIPIGPAVLSDALGGGVPRQSQVGIVARPDTGKTVVAISIATEAASRGFKVHYYGNEDSDKVMLARLLCSITGADRDTLFAQPDEFNSQAMESGWENIRFFSVHPGSIEYVKKNTKRYRPDIVILDQIRNMRMNGIAAEGMTDLLGRGSSMTREIAKEFDCVMVLVTQAGESAEGKLALGMTDVEYSNTGFAAQLDLMVGIGQNQQYKQVNRVLLSFPKWKLSAPIDPIPAKIHYDTNTIDYS